VQVAAVLPSPTIGTTKRGAGLLTKCVCGQQKLGWQYPEFIVKIGDKVWSVGRDGRTNTISCGPKGYHSTRYSNEPACG